MFNRVEKWARDGYSESLHGHKILNTRASGMSTPCQSRIVQANISPLRCHAIALNSIAFGGKLDALLPSEVSRFPPAKHFIHTFTRWVSESIQSGVSHWMRRAVFRVSGEFVSRPLSRGFDTWRAQTCSDALLEGARRDLDWRESVRYAFAHRGKQTCRQPIAFTCKPQSIILNGA